MPDHVCRAGLQPQGESLNATVAGSRLRAESTYLKDLAGDVSPSATAALERLRPQPTPLKVHTKSAMLPTSSRSN